MIVVAGYASRLLLQRFADNTASMIQSHPGVDESDAYVERTTSSNRFHDLNPTFDLPTSCSASAFPGRHATRQRRRRWRRAA